MNFYIADLHFGHKNVINFDRRPFADVDEMDQKLIEYWNARVSNQDDVYIVGDLCCRNEKPEEWYLSRLKGRKHLIIGNHDGKLLKNDTAMGYIQTKDKMMHVKDGKNHICVCHYPILEWNGYYKGHWHIYGHIHNHQNGTYAIMKSYTKPYASCRYTHPPVEAAIHLRNQYGITPEMVDKIKVKTYNLAVSGHDHTDIQGAYSAKMSTPYSTAVALIYGKAGLQEFGEDVIENDTVKALTKKVEVVADEELSSIFPDKQAAVLTIEANGKTHSERVDFPKGEPENPLSEKEFKTRYDALMAYGCVDKAVSDAIYAKVNEQNASVEELIEKL